MATVKKKATKTLSTASGELRVSLYDPGMTPVLRAGLGGLAAALLHHDTELRARVPNSAVSVDQTSVTLRWEERATDLVRALFELSFQLAYVRRDSAGEDAGMIYVPCAWGRLEEGGIMSKLTLSALGSATLGTVLQHNSCRSISKDSGVLQVVSIDGLDHEVSFNQVYTYTHANPALRETIASLLDAGPGKTVDLAGWAQPGGSVQFRWGGDSKVLYNAGQALCACFALVGTLSFRSRVAGANGVLAVPVPTDLREYAEVLQDLAPRSFLECTVSGTEDAALFAWARLRQARRRACVGEVHAMTFGKTASFPNQESRRSSYVVKAPPDDLLKVYRAAQTAFSNQHVFNEKSGLLVFPNHFRGTVTRNIARGRPWFLGWHATRDHEFKQIVINQHLRRGLYEMSAHLTDQQRAFVEAVHACLDKRFATLPKMYVGPQAYKKFDSIKDGYRLKLRAAKTHAVSRSILASFFSEGGGNTFTARGSTVTALVMRARDWEEVRDLALLALATYGEGKERKPKGGNPASPDAETSKEEILNERIRDFSYLASTSQEDVSDEHLNERIEEIAREIDDDGDTAGN